VQERKAPALYVSRVMKLYYIMIRNAHQVYSLPERSVFGSLLLLYLYKLIKGTAVILGERFDDLHYISQFLDIVA